MEGSEVFTPPAGPPTENGQPDGVEEWQFNKNGKAYVARGGGKPGTILRQGDDETVAEARARDALPKEERRPRRKPKTPKMPAAPRKVDLRQLEEPLAAALKAPGAIAMSFGDEWAFEHFENSGPYLARQLILAAQYNPWLRKRLEEAASGEEAMMRVMGFMAISGALVMYVVPPTIYFLNLKVPDKAREMLNVPPRREPDHAAPAPHPADQAGQPAFGA